MSRRPALVSLLRDVSSGVFVKEFYMWVLKLFLAVYPPSLLLCPTRFYEPSMGFNTFCFS